MRNGIYFIVMIITLLPFISCFLSNQKTGTIKSSNNDSDNFALLIIDVQNDYFEAGRLPLYNSLEALNNVEKVLKEYRNKGLPVIHVQHINPKGADFFEPDTWGVQIHERVTPLENEKLIIKRKVSSFSNIELERVLSEKGINSLVICGMQTNVCVETTAKDALRLGFKVSVLEDACAAKSQEAHNNAIDVLQSEPFSITIENSNGHIKELNSQNISKVYFTTDISPEGLMAVYQALGVEPTGKVAVKITTGESPRSNHLKPDLIKDLVQSVNGTFVEANTAYGGRRASTAFHKQLAIDHGYTAIAAVDILDENGSISLPVRGGTRLQENFVGAHFTKYDYYIVLSHFKGHEMAGLGGAIKNISIGIASSEGKAWIHKGGNSRNGMWSGGDAFLEAMAEAGKSVVDHLNGNILYINVMNRLSVDCDCNGSPAAPDMHDIGILSSLDPVALDQACVDLVYAAPDGGNLIRRMESRNGIHTIDHGAAIGLGSKAYELIKR